MPTPRAYSLCIPLIVTVVACATRPSQPAGPPPAPSLPPTSGLRVVLTWSAPIDLDLYLTDPTSETVYFGNTPSSHGARLVHDTRCRDVAAAAEGFLEVVHVPSPMPGRYRIGVDFIDACKAKPEPAGFRVVVELAGARRQATGTIRLEEFQPIVLEFEVQRVNGDGSLVLSQEEG